MTTAALPNEIEVEVEVPTMNKQFTLITLPLFPKFFFIASLFLLAAAFATNSRASMHCGDASVVNLIAGQHINAGTLTVQNNDSTLFITYETTNGWMVRETHLEVATAFTSIPQTKKGNPIPGKFSYSTQHSTTVAIVEFQLDVTQYAPGTELYIAAHAAVTSPQGSETAWAEGFDFPGRNWAMYTTYTVQECTNEPQASIRFEMDTYTFNEGTVIGIVNVVREHSFVGEITVSVLVNEITTDGNDFIILTDHAQSDLAADYTLTFTDGDSSAKRIGIIFIDERRSNEDPLNPPTFGERFQLQLTGGAVGSPDVTEITILDPQN